MKSYDYDSFDIETVNVQGHFSCSSDRVEYDPETSYSWLFLKLILVKSQTLKLRDEKLAFT